jgi:Flp pilus assembly pilin Flp
VAALEYGLFAALIAAVVVVTLTGMGADFGALYKDLKTRLGAPPSGGTPALPVATPAVNNAAAMSDLPYAMILQRWRHADTR